MKTINRVIRLFVFTICFTVNTIYGQITRVEINNELLYQPIDSFVRAISMKPADLGVIKMYFENVNKNPYLIDETANAVSERPLECEIVLELELNRIGVILRPPNHYFIYKDRPILIYTGVEQVVKHKKSQLRKFIRKIDYKLPPAGRVSFRLPSMRFMINNGKVQSITPKEDDK